MDEQQTDGAVTKPLWRRIAERRQWERDMDEEMRFHLDARVAHLMRSGLPEAEARRRAHLEFGSVENCKETCREASWPARLLDECVMNLRYAVRSLAKRPGFTAVGVISLALGIGANLAVFSLVEQLMLTSLPVHDPDTLYQVGRVRPEGLDNSHSCRHFQNLRRHTDIFDGVLVWSQGQRSVQVNGQSDKLLVACVSGTLFSRAARASPTRPDPHQTGRSPGSQRSRRGLRYMAEILCRLRRCVGPKSETGRRAVSNRGCSSRGFPGDRARQ